jgi:hypothetical protein
MFLSPQMLVRKQPKLVSGGGGPFSFISGVSTSVANGSGGSSGSINTTGAGLLVAVANYFSGASGLTFADSKGNTWTPLTAVSTTNTRCNIYYSVPTSVGTGHTISLTGSNVFPTLVFSAFAFGAASPADQQSSANGTGTSGAGSSITPGFANELVISGLSTNGDGVSISGIDGGFTVIDATRPASSGLYIGGAGAYLIQTTATAAAPTWSFGASQEWGVKMASFKVV